VHALQGQIGKPSVVVIAAVHHQQRPRFPEQLPCHPYLVLFASSDHRIAGEASIMVQQQMQLNRAFGAAKARPVEGAGAQIDHRGIHADQLVLEAELVLSPGLLHRQRPALA
jgi:hypothetical protein